MLKPLILKVLMAPALGTLFARLTRHRATVFMLHRFQNPDLGVEGHDPAVLRQVLARLRKLERGRGAVELGENGARCIGLVNHPAAGAHANS